MIGDLELDLIMPLDINAKSGYTLPRLRSKRKINIGYRVTEAEKVEIKKLAEELSTERGYKISEGLMLRAMFALGQKMPKKKVLEAIKDLH